MVGERLVNKFQRPTIFGFSLVAEIGWLARIVFFQASINFLAVSVSLPRLGGWRARWNLGAAFLTLGFSLVAEIGWLASQYLSQAPIQTQVVSVSLPRLGGWRALVKNVDMVHSTSFSLVAEIGWLARSSEVFMSHSASCFSLVAEIGWLASLSRCNYNSLLSIVSVSLPRLGGWRANVTWNDPEDFYRFQSRCRDWVVGKIPDLNKDPDLVLFQSRCRDWVVGEVIPGLPPVRGFHVSVSLPRLGGWRDVLVTGSAC